MAKLPARFYAVVGILVGTNLSTLVTLLVVIFKSGYFVAEAKAGITDAKGAAVRAHNPLNRIFRSYGVLSMTEIQIIWSILVAILITLPTAGCSHSILVKDCQAVENSEKSACKTLKPWE